MNALNFSDYKDARFYRPMLDLVQMAFLDPNERVREIAKTGLQEKCFEGKDNLFREFKLVRGFADKGRIYLQLKAPESNDILIDFGEIPEIYLGRKPEPKDFDRITYS